MSSHADVESLTGRFEASTTRAAFAPAATFPLVILLLWLGPGYGWELGRIIVWAWGIFALFSLGIHFAFKRLIKAVKSGDSEFRPGMVQRSLAVATLTFTWLIFVAGQFMVCLLTLSTQYAHRNSFPPYPWPAPASCLLGALVVTLTFFFPAWLYLRRQRSHLTMAEYLPRGLKPLAALAICLYLVTVVAGLLISTRIIWHQQQPGAGRADSLNHRR